MSYRAVLEVFPQGSFASVRITDGFTILLQGRIPIEKVQEFCDLVKICSSIDQILEIAHQFFLKQPLR